MIMPRKETCSICNEEYMANCMVEVPAVCDECKGVKPYVNPNKINSHEDYLNAIYHYDKVRYTNVSKSRDVGLESSIINSMVALLPKEHNWSSVRVWMDDDQVQGDAISDDGYISVIIQGKWIISKPQK